MQQDDDVTRKLETPKVSTTRASSYDSIDEARLVSATILADRYRIVGLLGIMAYSLAPAALIWLLYIALEPHVRKRTRDARTVSQLTTRRQRVRNARLSRHDKPVDLVRAGDHLLRSRSCLV